MSASDPAKRVLPVADICRVTNPSRARRASSRVTRAMSSRTKIGFVR
jgi:hypothetical protein